MVEYLNSTIDDWFNEKWNCEWSKYDKLINNSGYDNSCYEHLAIELYWQLQFELSAQMYETKT